MFPRLALVGVFLATLVAASAATRVDAPAATPPGRGPANPPPPEVTWEPERPVQGTLFRIRVRPDPGSRLTGVAGEAAGEELHFTRLPDGVFESLAPVPVDAEGRVDVTLRLRGGDGTATTRAVEVPVAPGTFRHEELTVAPELGGPLSPERQARLDRDREKAREVSRIAGLTPRLWSAEMRLPRDARVTSGFGNGRIFNGQVSSRHLGLDLDGDTGDTVRAVTGGVVALVDEFLLAGNIVYLNHGAGLLSGYFHLSEPLVEEGDTVRAGTPIGRVGATGRVTGPHLHWVVRYGTTSVDPRSLIAVAGG